MSSDGIEVIEVVDAVHARTTSREDRILSAKKKVRAVLSPGVLMVMSLIHVHCS